VWTPWRRRWNPRGSGSPCGGGGWTRWVELMGACTEGRRGVAKASWCGMCKVGCVQAGTSNRVRTCIEPGCACVTHGKNNKQQKRVQWGGGNEHHTYAKRSFMWASMRKDSLPELHFSRQSSMPPGGGVLSSSLLLGSVGTSSLQALRMRVVFFSLARGLPSADTHGFLCFTKLWGPQTSRTTPPPPPSHNVSMPQGSSPTTTHPPNNNSRRHSKHDVSAPASTTNASE